jgi:hypothetical protein
MRFDNKDLGLFSNEAPKKKKRRIKITEDQYNRLFNINEEDETSTDTSSSSGGGSVWTSGASSYPNLNRGKANPIGNTVWSSGASSYKNITRGKANPL